MVWAVYVSKPDFARWAGNSNHVRKIARPQTAAYGELNVLQ